MGSHDWLPNTMMHWGKVRCIDCHLSTSNTYMHQILDADQAVKHCEDCHSANSILLTKLYRYKMHESREKYGFLNSVALNEAYIIGMTRNVILDQLSFLIMGAMAMGIGVHCGSIIDAVVGRGRRVEYSVIGDPVNTAARIESHCKVAMEIPRPSGGEVPETVTILISADLFRQVRDHVVVDESVPPFEARGKAEPVQVVRLLGMREGESF